MDFKRLEDGNRQIVISRNETQDFEICMCGEGGLYLAADHKQLEILYDAAMQNSVCPGGVQRTGSARPRWRPSWPPIRIGSDGSRACTPE